MLSSRRCFVKASTRRLGQLRSIADAPPFAEGDLVLLRRKDDRTATPILTRPLKPGRRIDGHKGQISHNDIIGKRVRDTVVTLPKRQRTQEDAANAKPKPRAEYRLHEVKLEDYVRLTSRLVTPLYPQDARLIVDLLDLHPYELQHHGDGEGREKLEILEAGTGHGSLTLFLARAICAANIPLPPEADANALLDWKAKRNAILHTIEVSEKYSIHAQATVAGFRHGLYAPHVDFHVGDVADWTTTTLTARDGKPFLSHAFLDLPGADGKIASVADALRVDGTLIVFNPSITQIMDAAKRVKDEGVALDLDRVVELGVNGGSGGREWDVRPVRPRSIVKAEIEERAKGEGSGGEEEGADDSGVEMGRHEEVSTEDAAKAEAKDTEKKGGWSMVCRPKVGDRIVGGGFLGVWKKQRRE